MQSHYNNKLHERDNIQNPISLINCGRVYTKEIPKPPIFLVK